MKIPGLYLAENIEVLKFKSIQPNKGLIGFVDFHYRGQFVFRSVAVYVRRKGGFRLVYPRHNGINVVHPIDSKISKKIEAEVGSEIIAVLRGRRSSAELESE